jgi:hypothetical protein
MSRLSENFKKFIAAAQRSKEGKKLIENLTYTYQFDFGKSKEEPFHMGIKSGKISVKTGVSPLDWRKKDWEKINRIWTDKKTFIEILKGEKEIVEAQFTGRWSYSNWVATHSPQKWLNNLIRIAQEQVAKEALHNCFKE